MSVQQELFDQARKLLREGLDAPDDLVGKTTAALTIMNTLLNGEVPDKTQQQAIKEATTDGKALINGAVFIVRRVEIKSDPGYDEMLVGRHVGRFARLKGPTTVILELMI